MLTSLLVRVLGWIGDVFLVWGVWEIGNKRRIAHLLTMIGELAWIGKSLLVGGQWDLILICSIFFVLAYRCWVKWAEPAAPAKPYDPRTNYTLGKVGIIPRAD